MPNPNKREAVKFLEELFNDKPKDSNILIWSLPSKNSSWFTSIDKAAEYATLNKFKDAEVYVGCGLSAKDLGPKARCPAKEIIGISGVWADIDIKSSLHKKPNLPPNQKAAMQLIADAPLKPTVIVNSGGGLQIWWLFKEIWNFDSDEERKRAENITRGWNQALKNLAEVKGWDIDATWDLARIFRLPGTVNNKGKPRDVKIIKLNKNRYNPSDFEGFVSKTEKPTTAQSVKEISSKINLNPQVESPMKLFALLENIPKAKETWQKKRKDLQDQSPSSYDMAMTNYCVEALYEDQEIVDTLIAMRRKHGSDLKLRDDYYGRTIARARADVKIDAEVKEMDEVIDKIVDGEDTGEDIIEIINKRLNTKIIKLEKYLSDPPTYRIEIKENKSYHFSSKEILRQSAFRDRYFELSNRQPRFVKPAQWGKITLLISQHLDDNEVELGPEATDDGSVLGWVQQYIEQKKPAETCDKTVVERNLPWKDSDFFYVRNCDLRNWLARYLNIQVGHKELPKRLKNIGLIHITQSVLGGKTTRSYWKWKP